MVQLLEKEIANVELPAGRGRGVVGLKFFGKVDFELQRNLVIVFSLLIIFSDLLLRIGERVVGYPKKFRMFADPCDVFCCSLFAVPDAQLDEIGRVFRFSVIPKFHTLYYNNVSRETQHHTTLKFYKLDIKKAAVMRFPRYFSIDKC